MPDCSARPRGPERHRRSRARRPRHGRRHGLGPASQPVPRLQRRVQPVPALPARRRSEVRRLEAVRANRSHLHEAVPRDDEPAGAGRGRRERVDGVPGHRTRIEARLRAPPGGGALASYLGARGRRRSGHVCGCPPGLHPVAGRAPASASDPRGSDEAGRVRHDFLRERVAPCDRSAEAPRAPRPGVRSVRRRGRGRVGAAARGSDRARGSGLPRPRPRRDGAAIQAAMSSSRISRPERRVLTSAAVRESYGVALRRFLERWRTTCASSGIDYHRVTTDMRARFGPFGLPAPADAERPAMIHWLNPAALAGLALLALPILIHLLRTRQAERIPFPSLRFVLPSETAAVRLRLPADLAAAPGPPRDRGGGGDSGRRAGDRNALAGSSVECANRPRGDRRHVGGHPGGGCPGEGAAGRGARGRCNRRAFGASPPCESRASA